MNKLLIALALCTALVACKKDETATPAAAPAAETAATSTTEPAATPAQAGLPKECEDYINRVKACVAKAGGDAVAKQFQTALDQSKAQWESAADKTALVPQCVQANDMFAQQAAMLKCE